MPTSIKLGDNIVEFSDIIGKFGFVILQGFGQMEEEQFSNVVAKFLTFGLEQQT